MSKKVAIVDVPKSGGNPLLSLPVGAKTKKNGSRWRITFGNKVLFADILLSNSSRWVACAVAPERAFSWLEQNLGASVYELTYDLWQAHRVKLDNLGLVGEFIDGKEVLRLPHVIAGQSAFIQAPE